MSPAQDDYSTQCDDSGHEPSPRVLEDLERARVVGVLDAWQAAQPARAPKTVRRRVEVRRGDFGDWECCCETLDRFYKFGGPTPDAARAAAAKAIESGEV